MELGGAHEIRHIAISSEEITGANIVTIGDSKTIGYFSNTFAGRYAAQLNNNYPVAIINAGGGDRVTNVLNRRTEIEQLAGTKYLLSIGSNDLRFGSPLAELQDNYDSLVKIIEATGATVYHIVLPEDHTKTLGVNLLAFKNWVAATYPATYINVWDSLSSGNILKGIYDTGDGVHLNQAANNKIYEAIVTSNKLGGGATLPVRLEYFDVKRVGANKAEIKWKADPFQQAEKYEVLRSTDGSFYETIFTSAANINGTGYFTDPKVPAGTVYYKLEMTEIPGIISYSKIVILKDRNNKIEILSVQRTDPQTILVNFYTPTQGNINWRIVSSAGKVISKNRQPVNKGNNTIRVRYAGTTREIHFLEINGEDGNGRVIYPFY
jgi:lysophospholipase L1-like esterase